MSADTQNQPSPNDNQTKSQKGNESDAFAQIQEQLRAMNEASATQSQVLADVVKRLTPKEEPVEENLYDPNVLVAKATAAARKEIADRDARDAVINRLTAEYPEISRDEKIQADILKNQRNLPSHLQLTPEGYEMAIRRAVGDAGLVPKSKRKTETLDEDVSMAPRGSGSRKSQSRQQSKASEMELAAAREMGIDTEDPEVRKRLDQYSGRNWLRYE